MSLGIQNIHPLDKLMITYDGEIVEEKLKFSECF
jgi:hypothetical protein